jgi:uncharacterized Zn-binding protein involved in type VI secretion
MPQAARLSDPHPEGPIVRGSPNVFINGLPAARQSDEVIHSNHPPEAIVKGSSTVFINGLPAARLGDPVSCGDPITNGSPNVIIGG